MAAAMYAAPIWTAATRPDRAASAARGHRQDARSRRLPCAGMRRRGAVARCIQLHRTDDRPPPRTSADVFDGCEIRPATCTGRALQRRTTGAGQDTIGGMHNDNPHLAPRISRITLDGLTKRFGDVLAVQGVSFTTEPGTVAAFLGPNGAGKTTSLRMLLGRVRPRLLRHRSARPPVPRRRRPPCRARSAPRSARGAHHRPPRHHLTARHLPRLGDPAPRRSQAMAMAQRSRSLPARAYLIPWASRTPHPGIDRGRRRDARLVRRPVDGRRADSWRRRPALAGIIGARLSTGRSLERSKRGRTTDHCELKRSRGDPSMLSRPIEAAAGAGPNRQGAAPCA